MTAKQLTNSILQLAIQGKLVPQDPNEEPASVLLERIREEKKRLVKEKMLKKKELEEKTIYDDEIPFDIPDSWVWVRLKSITKSITDGDHQPPPQSLTGVPFLVISNVISGNLDFSNTRFVPEEYYNKLSDERKARKNDLLFTVTGSYGKAVLVNTERSFCFQRHIALVRPLCYVKYLLFVLNSPYIKRECDDKATGMAQKTVGLDTLRSFCVPLPPIKEQHRIVERIEEILPIVKEYGEAYEKASKMDADLPDRLKKSILQEAIKGKLGTQNSNDEPASVLLEQIRKEKKRLVKEGLLKKKDLLETPVEEDEKPFKIPESWEWIRIGNVYKTSSGGTPEKGHLEYYDGDIPWVKVGDLTSIYIDHTEDKITEEGLNSSSAKIFPKDTILLAMYCNDAIGKSSILTKPMTTNQAICGLYPNPYLHKEYVYYAIQSNRRKLQEQSAGGAQKNINQKIVNDLIIPLPPLAEQHRIVEKIEALFAEIDNMTINNNVINETKTEEREE